MKPQPIDDRDQSRQANLGTDESARDKAGWLLLKKALGDFRASAQASAERPELFWESQRQAVHGRLSRKLPARRHRTTLAWASAIVVVAFGVAILIEREQPARPDFAAGYDQQLLLDVDRALDRELPAALEPAAMLPEEIFPVGRIAAEP